MYSSFGHALITGATSGIGEALARLLAKKGIPLMLTGRNRGRLEQLKEELSKHVTVSTVVADLAEREERQKVLRLIQQQKPDLVINNAGVGLYGSVMETEKEEQLNVIEVDVMALTDLTIEAAQALFAAKKKGIILNVSSVAGFTPFPCFATYAASKAYVNSFSQAIDIELEPFGIRILTSCPGMVDTDFGRRASHGSYGDSRGKMDPTFAAEEIWKQIQQQKPLHVFNFRYRLAVLFLRFFSSCRWLLKKLEESIKIRISSIQK